MVKARQQAKQYAEALPDEWPPFLVVVDVGHCFDLYADFSGSGKNYVPFPDPHTYRIPLAQLADEDTRATLRGIWLDPASLDPGRRSAKITREVAARLARLAMSLEEVVGNDGQRLYAPDDVAQFLMRCLFTMFAEDVKLIPEDGFTDLLKSLRETPEQFVPMVGHLWETMNSGGFSPILRKDLKQFNGGLFEQCTAFPLNRDQLELLIEAAESQWKHVEPAIFGTLLERALDSVERHKLGAHYTPRAYVERLVMPTIIEPLRRQWDASYATAVQFDAEGKTAEAVKAVRTFHEQLCETRVLDPACGSGNFLYVSLELMKRLEGEVLNALREFGERQLPLLTIDPHQFLGIEVNPRAAAITDLVLWIGYLQWHFRTRGSDPLNEPIIRKFENMECRDAVLAWDAVEPVVDDQGNPVTRWDGRTTKPHPVTGEEVPDENAQVQELRYVNPRKAEWPETDYVVGNPPFVGNSRMRESLGDGYTKVIRSIYSDLPESCDYVMFWWHKAADLVRGGKARRFGLITTNSLRQTFNRRVVAPHLSAEDRLSLLFAIPDHPWVDSADGAAVRIAMSVGVAGIQTGRLLTVWTEYDHSALGAIVEFHEREGVILSNLSVGVDTANAHALRANNSLSCPGVKLHGAGFIVTADEAQNLGLGRIKGIEQHIREYRNGRDLTQHPRGVMVIDLFGLTAEEVRERFPEINQRVHERVKPERDQNRRASYRERWWIHGEARSAFRPALAALPRYIATVETSKHRFFVFLDKSILSDNRLVNIALDDAYYLGIASSSLHSCWALKTGAVLEDRPVYTKSECFEKFPFPAPDDASKDRIRDLAEQLDAHRKRQQEQFPKLTLTGMYNVLEKLRSGETLTKKEKEIHQQGLVSVLKQIHDDLDAAVADAYGWPHDLADEEILERLVALNHERAEEEKRGLIRWLRPEFQNPDADRPVQKTIDLPEKKPKITDLPVPKLKKAPWPKTLPERIQAVGAALAERGGPATSEEIAKRFSRAQKKKVAELLETLTVVGQVRKTDDGRYVTTG